MSTAPATRGPSRGSLRTATILTAGLVVVAILGFVWSKWVPYAIRIDGLVDTHAWEGGALLAVAEEASSPWMAAWDFSIAYTEAVWKALLVGLVIAAGIDALVPKAWIRRALTRRTSASGAAVAGAACVPSMMCTCCAAPVAVSLRRGGVPVSSVVAYWLGNPVLNLAWAMVCQRPISEMSAPLKAGTSSGLREVISTQSLAGQRLTSWSTQVPPALVRSGVRLG